MFDEPSSYLDVKQRIRASKAIRSLLKQDNYVVVVEHDLAVLDYLSDFICVLYGQPGTQKKAFLHQCVRSKILNTTLFATMRLPVTLTRHIFNNHTTIF